MRKYPFLMCCIWLILASGCKQEVTFKEESINQAYQKLLSDKSDENIKQFIALVDKSYANDTSKTVRVALLHNALDVCNKLSLEQDASKYTFALLNEDFDSEKTPSILWSYAERLRMSGKILPSEIMYMGIAENFPKTDEAKNGKKYVLKSKDELRTILVDQSKKVFNTNGQLDEFKAKDFINNAESWAVAMPKDTAAGSFLFMAAEVARASASWTKAMSLYTNLVQKYPQHKQAAIALFIKGFLMETQLKDTANAVKIFKQFLELYPKHPFADDAKFLMENAGKDENEMLKAAQGR